MGDKGPHVPHQEVGAQTVPGRCGIPEGGCPSIMSQISISHSAGRYRQLPKGQMFATNLRVC